MSKCYMCVIYIKENGKINVLKIPKTIKYMKKLVEGDIEIKRYEKVLIVYNINQDDSNLETNNISESLKLKGNIIIVGNDEKIGDIRSLTRKEIAKYINNFLNKNNIKEREE